MTEQTKRKMTTVEKAQLSMSFASPVLIFLFFIIIFVFMVKFDKNGFYPSYDLIKNNYSLLQQQKFDYNNKQIDSGMLLIFKERKDVIEKYSDIYNDKLGFLKNKQMLDLRQIYNGYILKLNEINKNARHEQYLNKVQYEDVLDTLPTEKQMSKINDSLPKPFFSTFLKAAGLALLIQFILYNIIIQPLKIIFKNKKEI